jgi:hypothetical protein
MLPSGGHSQSPLESLLGGCGFGMSATRMSKKDARLPDPERVDTENTIFVSIAAYRDPELAATIEDCLDKARWPDRLRFGICWQHGPGEVPPHRLGDPRFRVLDPDWTKSRGPCWARSRIMKLWQGERWYLQLDSHHRFAPDWDAKLLAQAAATGSPKPILSTYPGSFYPENPTDLSDVPTRMDFGGFTRDGLVILHPDAIADWQTSTAPRRGRFLAAGFLFAPGRFVTDVPYDPYLYFFGEEITLAVRAFTHGYDFFHPGVGTDVSSENYKNLIAEIENYTSAPVQKSAWIVVTSDTSKTVPDRLKSHMHAEDRLFVMQTVRAASWSTPSVKVPGSKRTSRRSCGRRRSLERSDHADTRRRDDRPHALGRTRPVVSEGSSSLVDGLKL